MARRVFKRLKKMLCYLGIFFFLGIVFVKNAPAPPLFPNPPEGVSSVPAGNETGYLVTVFIIALYGGLRAMRKK